MSRRIVSYAFIFTVIITSAILSNLSHYGPDQGRNVTSASVDNRISLRETAHPISVSAEVAHGDASASSPDKSTVISKVNKLHVPFVANQGQTGENVKFYARTFGGTVFVTGEGEIVYSLSGHQSAISGQNEKTEAIKGLSLKEQLVGAKVAEVKGEGDAITKVSYFRGSDPSKWVSAIPTYDFVNLGEVYDGIELKLKAYGNNVEKLFYVKPGAESANIQVRLDGATGLSVNDDGELVVETEQGEVKFTKPIAYQEIEGKRTEVTVQYVVANPKSLTPNTQSAYSFIVGDYDKSKELVIDPLLASTFFGGKGNDEINAMALGQDGSVYITGRTYSTDFPAIEGSYNSSCTTSFNSYCDDAYIAKLNSDLTNLMAFTYIGGGWSEYYTSIALDHDGNVFIAGTTRSSDFPTTTGAYAATCKEAESFGCNDIFIAKLSGDLSVLKSSTYLGGNFYDYVRSICTDPEGNVYAAGTTLSSDFPVTEGALDISFNGVKLVSDGGEGFISRLNGDLTTLLSSTFLGGSSSNSISSILIGPSGSLYAVGSTSSSDFPVTKGAYKTSRTGWESDAFISKVTGDLSAVLASTYLGGSQKDAAIAVALDNFGNIVVSGSTQSSDFPISAGAYDTSFNSGIYNTDVFVSKLDSDLNSLLSSTYLGGSSTDIITSMSIDGSGNIFVTGRTTSLDFPLTAWAYDTSANGNNIYNPTSDVFISRLKGDLKILLSSTLLGGSFDDYVSSLAFDKAGNVYVSGSTGSYDFPVTQDVYGAVHGNHPVCINSATPSTQDDLKITVTIDTACSKTSSSHTITGNDIRIDITRTSVGNICPAMIMWGKVTEDIGYLAAGQYTVTIYKNNQLFASRAFEVKDIPASELLDCPVIDGYLNITDGFISKFDPWLSSETGGIGVSVSPAVLNFETVGLGKTSAKGINITNISDKTQTLGSVTITGTDSGDFSQTSACSELAAGGSCEIPVTFSPTSKGTKSAKMSISFAGIDTPVEISLSGTGQQQYTLTILKAGAGSGSVFGTGLDCGNDTPCTQTYAEGTWVKVMAHADKESRFEKYDGACTGKGHCSLKMDSDKTVTVTFAKVGPAIVLPEVLNFGKVRVNRTKTKKLRIMKKGKGTLTITGISGDSSEFIGNWSGQREMNSAFIHDITFVPVSGGPKTATLTISSDDPNHPTKTVTLKGIGTGSVGIPQQ